MKTNVIVLAAIVVMVGLGVSDKDAAAQPSMGSFVERNSDVVGRTIPGQYRGYPARQDNEPSCDRDSINTRIYVCAWNASGGSDDPDGPGDTWIRMSNSADGGINWNNRYIYGSRMDPASDIGVQFMADPVTLCHTAGCFILGIGANRVATGGGVDGGIYIQRMFTLNNATDIRMGLEPRLVQAFASTGQHFADKVAGTFALDPSGGTQQVSMQVEMPDGSIQTVTRDLPNATFIIVFTYFNSSRNDFEILSMTTDNYGQSFSNPKQVATGSGHPDQGSAVSVMGNDVLYVFRTFPVDGETTSSVNGALSRDLGQRIGKPFTIMSDFCAYDTPTIATATATASRHNAFPSVSNNGEFWLATAPERKRNSDGGCLSNFDEPTDSRIMMTASANGKTWTPRTEVAPNPDHGFQFFAVTDCSLGICQVGWWDSVRDSLRAQLFLGASVNPVAPAALQFFENYPVLADFNFNTGPNTVMQFRRSADPYTTKVRFEGGQPIAAAPAVRVSRYREGRLPSGEVVEKQIDWWNFKSYRDNFSSFMGDYSSMMSIPLRFVFDPETPEIPGFWEDNASMDPRNPGKDPEFFMAFVSSRNVAGHVFTAQLDGQVPFTNTPPAAASTIKDKKPTTAPDAFEEQILTAESVEDFNPLAGFCGPVPNPGPGEEFFAINNRTKDHDIYGANIESKAKAYSLDPTKTLNVQRAYTIVTENGTDLPRTYKLLIANQPIGSPDAARASFDQLPFDPSAFLATAPNTMETFIVGPKSSEATAVFVVALTDFNPVVVNVFEVVDPSDPSTDILVDVITVNGTVESGPFLNADGTPNNFEIHNPFIYTPDEFNPDEFNPDEYNPDEFNPALYTPDEFNPDEFNPDEFNPDEFNPDEFNPDEFNPDEFNPDEFNPDEFNPDEFNSTLTDTATIHNPDIADPELGDITGLVVKLDINWGIENRGNVITPYTVDFAVTDPLLLQMLENGEIVTQLIIWQDKKIEDVQFCEQRIIAEDHVITTINNPDLTSFNIPTIDDNRNGIATVVIAPLDVMQVTIRFIAPLATMQVAAPLINSQTISHVVASLAANTGSDKLFADEELIINDVGPPIYNLMNGDELTYEAEGPNGAVVPTNAVTASKNGEAVAVNCTPALGSTIGLDINNSPAGSTPMSCSATASNGVTATLDIFISVLDRSAPTIDQASVPASQTVEATSAAGAVAVFTTPTATDPDGVDPSVEVSCDPATGSVFPFVAPGPTTTAVTCTATDDSLNTDTATFDVTVQDTTPPDLIGLPVDFGAEADQAAGALVLFAPPTANDIADPAPSVVCAPLPNTVFPLGPTLVNCQASDASGNSSFGAFTVTVADTVLPVLSGIPANMTLEATGPAGAVAIFTPPTATDLGSPLGVTCDANSGDTFPLGTTTVSCTSAADGGGNTASASFDITVEDTTPPNVTAPADITVVLDDVSGAVVNFVVTAADIVDPSPDVTCSPASGSLFPVGTTTVTCSATDDSGNTSVVSSFDVKVEYGTGSGLSSNKSTFKVGSVAVFNWVWTNSAGDPVFVDPVNQDIEARAGDSCPSSSDDILDEDPGSSDLRVLPGFINQYNWQTVDSLGNPVAPVRYCVTVFNLLTGQIQETIIRGRP